MAHFLKSYLFKFIEMISWSLWIAHYFTAFQGYTVFEMAHSMEPQCLRLFNYTGKYAFGAPKRGIKFDTETTVQPHDDFNFHSSLSIFWGKLSMFLNIQSMDYQRGFLHARNLSARCICYQFSLFSGCILFMYWHIATQVTHSIVELLESLSKTRRLF